jgi:hypothetical protein
MLAMVTVVSFALILSEKSFADCTLGTKDCRHQIDPVTHKPTNQCFWWECKQLGSETGWIFTGQPCTCPDKVELNFEEYILLARNSEVAAYEPMVPLKPGEEKPCDLSMDHHNPSSLQNRRGFTLDVKICVDIVNRWEDRMGWNPTFDCYISSDCQIHCNGSGGEQGKFQFYKCMTEQGWPMN